MHDRVMPEQHLLSGSRYRRYGRPYPQDDPHCHYNVYEDPDTPTNDEDRLLAKGELEKRDLASWKGSWPNERRGGIVSNNKSNLSRHGRRLFRFALGGP